MPEHCFVFLQLEKLQQTVKESIKKQTTKRGIENKTHRELQGQLPVVLFLGLQHHQQFASSNLSLAKNSLSH